jgi:hypothetical protein
MSSFSPAAFFLGQCVGASEFLPSGMILCDGAFQKLVAEKIQIGGYEAYEQKD